MEAIDFTKGNGLVPAIVQDADSRKVLMLGYLDQEALEATQASGRVTFFSRSKNRHWTKGETSGNYLNVVDIRVDCDRDTLLILARPDGPVCHTGTDTCWGDVNSDGPLFLEYLEGVIAQRRTLAQAPSGPGKSYVASLFASGIPKVAQKVGEEAVETVIEAMADNDQRFLEESADLLFHYLVLLQAKGFALEDVLEVLRGRHTPGR